MQALYSIGEVHEMTGMPVSTIRYYADMGIVVPERIDGQTGYRYYSFDDIRRLETVGYLKRAGLSLEEIGRVMREKDPGARADILEQHRRQTLAQLTVLKDKLSLMEWLQPQPALPEGRRTEPSDTREDEASGRAYKIRQKTVEMRRVLLAEAERPSEVQPLYVQASRQWRRLGIAAGQRTMGYLVNEGAFMQEKCLKLDGQFLLPEDGEDFGKDENYLIPGGNYICLTTAVFGDERWIRALSRYFAERGIRPRNILAVLSRQDFYEWRRSLYEVQILI